MASRKLAGALLLTAAGAAQAQPPLAPSATQDLYQDALQSIADGRKSDASDALTRVIENEPLHAGAWIDLALIQCGLGNADKAEPLFAAIETRFAPPLGILELIANAREQGCRHWQAHSAWSLTFGRGIDNNVNQGASDAFYTTERDGTTVVRPLLPDFLPRHDRYSALSAQFVRDLTPNGGVGFLQFQGRRNDRLSQYDSSALFAGAEIPWRLGRWTVHGTGMLGLTTLGGEAYQRQLQLQARVGPPLALPAGVQFSMVGGLTHNEFLTLSNFNSNLYELRGQLHYRREGRSASASLGYLSDQAEAARPGGSRRGWLLALAGRERLSHDFTAELAYTRQGWNSQSAYSPGLIEQVRLQATHALRAALIYPLSSNQSLQLELRAVRNRENISVFQYNDRQLQLIWQWQSP